MEAIKIAAAGFVIPFMAVYTPALMLQDGGPLGAAIGYYPAVAYIAVKAILAIGLWGACVTGFMTIMLRPHERLLALIAALALVAALPITDEIGLALVALFAFIIWRRKQAESIQPADARLDGRQP